MEFAKFQQMNQLHEKSELDKVYFIAAYMYIEKNQTEFSIDDIVNYLTMHNYNMPNRSRLRQKLRIDKRFNSKGEKFCLSPKEIASLKEKVIYEDFITIESNSEFLDETLFPENHNYLVRLVKQINASYENNLYDATAVLVRRVFEILLIKTYQNLGIDDEIKKGDGYLTLEKIIDNALSNSKIKLSRSKKELDNVRNIGNFSAHKIEFNANRNDLDKIKDSCRAIVEELLFKAGLK